LTEAIKNQDNNVRQQALAQMARFGRDAKDAVPQVVEALKDPADDVRFEAILVLSEIGNTAKGAVPMLRKMIEQGDLKEAAIWAVKQIEGEN
jgi:HEAT repeat protein